MKRGARTKDERGRSDPKTERYTLTLHKNQHPLDNAHFAFAGAVYHYRAVGSIIETGTIDPEKGRRLH
jgi:hypothetical protein